ncbi:hypothetical protein GGR88_000413 [Sphingomonas jejuensis]|uniref:Uncharacterized protein n=1 Tax=Sphingomonas jejuensis TaxID=904715 RepID=A0ABX0XHZ2_9SPHN|nr:hypothetical protein [Sphingomonas jejuensis]NJC32939.1 hypothetical protein [Sphingomonas jejuensis]
MFLTPQKSCRIMSGTSLAHAETALEALPVFKRSAPDIASAEKTGRAIVGQVVAEL